MGVRVASFFEELGLRGKITTCFCVNLFGRK